MFQFPLLNTMLQGSGKGLTADQNPPEVGLMALLQGADGETGGFTGELQAMLMQLSPPVLQRLDALLAGGTSLPQAAKALLSELAADADGRAFPDLLHKLAQGSNLRPQMGGTAPTTGPLMEKLSGPLMEQVPGPSMEQVPGQLPGKSGLPTAEPQPLRADPQLLRADPQLLRADPLQRANNPTPPPLLAALPDSPAAAATMHALGALATGSTAGSAGAMSTASQPSMPPQLTSSLLDMGVPQQVGSKTWSEAVAQRVMWMVQGDQQFARLKLNPPNLGPLEVRVSVTQEQTNVSFLAQHAAVREALEAALPRLREMFEQNSLQLVRADVSDPGAQQGGRSGESGPDSGPDRGPGRDAGLGTRSGDGEFSDEQPQDVASSGLVDLFA